MRHNYSQIAIELVALHNSLTKPNWMDVSPLAVDAIYGTLALQGWRATLNEYCQQHPEALAGLLSQTIQRIEFLDIYERPQATASLPCRMGIGTYGWKYDGQIIQRAIEYGLRFIDTAESYGFGRVEDRLGSVVGIHSEVVVATKVARNHMAYQSVLNAAVRSIKNLGGPLKVYQIHWPTDKLLETVQAMQYLYLSEHVIAIGACNMSIDQLLFVKQKLFPISLRYAQRRYSLLDRSIERVWLPYCQRTGMIVIAYSPLGQAQSKLILRDTLVKDVAKRCGATPPQVALAWLMSHANVLPIPRTNNPSHLKELAEALDLVLTPQQIAELEDHFPISE